MAPSNDSGHGETTYTSRMRGFTSDAIMPIAIIGMGCKLPGDATSPEGLWRLCSEKRDAWSTFPKDRIKQAGFYHPDSNRAGSSYVEGAHFMKEDLAHFDAPFFNITPQEAASMDPQQRMMLECSYEALENAGIPLEEVIGSRTGVFAGSFNRDWTDNLNRDIDALPFYQATGTGHSMLANRLSYFYDLRGPSIAIDTACSSSLVALHQACQSLRTGESDQAIVGGSNIILSLETMISMSRMTFLSKKGKSYAYDSRAHGYGRGEGCVCIVLKPLWKAIQDGDTIRAIVRNTGTNSDGKTHGITLPSQEAQESLIREVYARAGLNPINTTYIEGHGTGTKAGDPIEAGALSNVFTKGRSIDNPLYIGSIKSNIGHLEGCSGLASLVKVVLMLENSIILPNANFEDINPEITARKLNVKVPNTVQPWPCTGVRRASISNFGYGGSNAHAILDDASNYLASRGLTGQLRLSNSSSLSNKTTVQQDRLFVFSARCETSAKLQATNLASWLRRSEQTHGVEADLAFTLGYRRSRLNQRYAIVANSSSDLADKLESFESKPVLAKRAPRLGFVFTGQGAQWFAMGRELISAYPIFRASILKSEKYLKIIDHSWSLMEELQRSKEESKVNVGFFSQPCCTAIQIALIELLASWNILPSSVTGHSSGEIAAAYSAGAVSHEAALTISYYRGLAGPTIKAKHPEMKGAMLAVGLSRSAVQEKIASLRNGKVVVACVNSPSSVTISGDDSAITELSELLVAEGVFARRVKVDIAYHSHHMQVVAEEYLAALKNCQPHKGNGTTFFSSVTGRRITTSELTPEYWVQNMVSTVEFSGSLYELCMDGKEQPAVDVLIEVGPAGALQGPMRQVLQTDSRLKGVSITSVLQREQNAIATSLKLAADLFKWGHELDFDQINGAGKLLVDLPSYAWNHKQRHWCESRRSKELRSRSSPRTDILGARVIDWNPFEPKWKNYVRMSELPWLQDHKIQGSIVYPAGGYIAMAFEAARDLKGDANIKLKDITIGNALVVDQDVEIMFSMTSGLSEEWTQFRIYSITSTGSWTKHCEGFMTTTQTDLDMPEVTLSPAMNDVDIPRLYRDLDNAGLSYGPTFALIQEAKASAYETLSTVITHDTASIMPANFEYPIVMHPGTVDAFIQTLFPGVMAAEGSLKDAMVPTFIKSVSVTAQTHKADMRFTLASKTERHEAGKTSSVVLATDMSTGRAAFSIEGLVCSRLPRVSTSEEAILRTCYRTEWIEKSLDLSTVFVKSPEVVILGGKNKSNQIRPQLEQALVNAGCQITKDCSNIQDKICIVVGDDYGSVLSNPDEIEYQHLKSVLLKSGGALWISRNATDDCSSPEQSLISGLVRAIRLESSAPITTFDISNETDAATAARMAVSILHQTFQLGSLETEFTERDGRLLVPRIAKDEDVSSFISGHNEGKSISFDRKGSYLLVGGLGGLGREIAAWMVSQGAKHLVITSRRGMTDPKAAPFKQRLLQAGAESVHIAARDICQIEQLSLLQSEIAHPIRGVINCAMVMHNEFFATLPRDRYLDSIGPKVSGTWNLHTISLDFMISLSSAIGTVGNASQAAYAAASTFLDAFASYRVQQGLPCVSIALGMIEDAGHVAENKTTRTALESVGFQGIPMSDVLRMVEYSIRNPFHSTPIISGLGTYKTGDEIQRPVLAESRFETFRTFHANNTASMSTKNSSTSDGLTSKSFHEAIASDVTTGQEILLEAIKHELTSLLMRDTIESSLSMRDQGLDSLVAVQVHGWILKFTGIKVGVLEVLGPKSLEDLVQGICERVAKK